MTDTIDHAQTLVADGEEAAVVRECRREWFYTVKWLDDDGVVQQEEFWATAMQRQKKMKRLGATRRPHVFFHDTPDGRRSGGTAPWLAKAKPGTRP